MIREIVFLKHNFLQLVNGIKVILIHHILLLLTRGNMLIVFAIKLPVYFALKLLNGPYSLLIKNFSYAMKMQAATSN